MVNFIQYPLTATMDGQLDISKLKNEIETSNPELSVMNLLKDETEFVVVLFQEITPAIISSVDAVVASHNGLTNEEKVRHYIKNAMNFGTDLMIFFAAENVLMGITQLGKTKEVSDYLSNITRYIQTGSLYEVIKEIDLLIATGLPQDLEPFITEQRLLEFRQKIQDYLS